MIIIYYYIALLEYKYTVYGMQIADAGLFEHLGHLAWPTLDS